MEKKDEHQEENNSSSPSKDGPKQKIFKYYIKETEERTREFVKKNQNLLDTRFYLLQTIKDKKLLRDMIFNLAYFYDNNYIGNKDFIHIPNIKNILDNVQKYPVILATNKDENGMDEILGVSTIKFENNEHISDNPYFPTVNETVLTITGILTKLNAVDRNNNRIKGIGKELFKSSIKAAYNVNKEKKVRLICEIDCRNIYSLKAISKAVEELKQEQNNINLLIDGYYEIMNKQGELTEAPTFILEIDLDGSIEMSNDNIQFDYSKCKFSDLFTDLNSVIENNTKEIRAFVNKKDDKIVIYHSLEAFNALNVTLNVGNTAEGNERVPSIPVLQYEQSSKN